MNPVVCNLCDTKLSYKRDLPKHQTTERCKSIHKFINDKINIHIIEKMELQNKNTILQNELSEIKKQLEEKNYKIKTLENIHEEYKNLIEFLKSSNDKNISKFTNSFKKKYEDETTFQIDINLNHKQLNKTKFKDVPEEQVKKDIQSLKLKDNYQLEYRDQDGFINITNLCKAGGKKFNDWNRLDKTKRFLDVLSSSAGIPVNEIIKYDSGSIYERSTWSHPQVAINIAQWISPEFDVLVSKWVYEIMLTGKVDIRDNKTTQELDKMNIENKLLKNRIKLLESKVLQKQSRETFEENKNVIYIVTTEYKEAQGHYKIGKAQDLQKRLSVYNTTDKHEVIYNTSCKNKKSMDLLEQIVHMKLEDKRVEPNKEWFLSDEDGEDLIKVIEECKKMFN